MEKNGKYCCETHVWYVNISNLIRCCLHQVALCYRWPAIADLNSCQFLASSQINIHAVFEIVGESHTHWYIRLFIFEEKSLVFSKVSRL